MAFIELKDVTKEFNNQVVLRGIDLEIKSNEFVTLLGPSGCGKTTTLRIIGGFIEPTGGEVLFDGVDILKLPAYKRPTNTVFQRYSLFPHLNVFENVAFGLRVKDQNREAKKEITTLKEIYKKQIDELQYKVDHDRTSSLELKNQVKLEKKALKEKLDQDIKDLQATFISKKKYEFIIEEKVSKYLKMVGLDGYENRSISKLSGGQMQRVAIARALINEPKVLLLDEPLAALDLKLRQEMQYELKEIQRSAGITFIFVTHDQEEALTMSDKIVVMNKGEIQQVGTPVDIYNEPINRFVANFIGESNIVSGIMKQDYLVHFDGFDFECVDKGFDTNQEVDIVLRPEDLDIVELGTGKISGIVDSVVFKGVHFEIDVKTEHRIYTVHTTDFKAEGMKVDLDWFPEDIHVMEVW
ncbi:ABC transporter ATP-binding protein [Acholeplasma laidlawii]|uniref:ABC-type transport system, ATPase component n=1 Tax=Acholeplasma laidlawii (strain PG-8A) TaxID=441768 RepID=A9NFG0_ACHLI|nr:ABC transporter ATP-binding protein [Acholeplasma laidlawii]ABX81090.1 ABC-type transport system, ATPase component [Acholeplasma laidlawii PG-8A]NWH10342.1 ABC transporter ATP-binding protein [Acholeplasma laidlawii]NWH11731.1 ABC transporter ATP-binding protein [Acholeplasma laidlawii]NWH12861.1 ABC transporter ATP-binding protein [Acholeplasma laidlawii]NWH15193.1 ABC transporter ATP-binding protein [Acholeplasma laidlawii]